MTGRRPPKAKDEPSRRAYRPSAFDSRAVRLQAASTELGIALNDATLTIEHPADASEISARSETPLVGLMMDMPLLVSSIIDHAARWNGDSEIVTRNADKSIHRYDYAAARARSAQLAHALRALGIQMGDRVATLAWNSYRHFECYYAISGIGAVLHTLNPRLFADQLEYIVNHARDRYIFLDPDLVRVIEPLASRLPTVEGYVILSDEAGMPATSLPNAICYETLLRGRPDDIEWPQFDERAASSLCYTSGTTGNPKGALYSHRSTLLHAYSAVCGMRTGTHSYSTVLPIVPMFHANAWAIAYTAPMAGAKLVFPGPHLDPASLYELFENERVTMTAGVPTVWLWLIAYMRERGLRFSTLQMLGVGGSAAPRPMIEAFENEFGVTVFHGWGMTETSPVATVGIPKQKHDTLPNRLDYKMRMGRPAFGVQLKIVDDEGNELPRDGVAQGDLLVRGPWVVSGYHEDPEATARAITRDGWFRTGDIASLDQDGYIFIRDRSKDVIKSGGEWISSIDLEAVVLNHPDVAEAAAIGVPHPTWAERPVLVIVPKAGSRPDRAGILAYLNGKVAKWWMPDDVLFVDELPHTATGKISKLQLRDRLKDYRLPELTGPATAPG